jgi:hypothetical protein
MSRALAGVDTQVNANQHTPALHYLLLAFAGGAPGSASGARARHCAAFAVVAVRAAASAARCSYVTHALKLRNTKAQEASERPAVRM